MSLIYLTLEEALDVHKKTVEISGGGRDGIIDSGRLESILVHIQNDEYYPEFVDKLTHLFYATCTTHCFEDGNKRIAISLCAGMLILNGYLNCSSRFIQEMENISYHVARGKIQKELLRILIEFQLTREPYTEEIQLKLIEVMSE